MPFLNSGTKLLKLLFKLLTLSMKDNECVSRINFNFGSDNSYECCWKTDLFRVVGCTYPTMVGMLSGISNIGVISWKMLEFLVILIPKLWLYFKKNKFYTILKTKNLPICFTLNRSIFAWHSSYGSRHIKRFLKVLVVVIPKEGSALFWYQTKF